MNETVSQVTSAMIVIYVLQWLKAVPWIAKVISVMPVKDSHVYRLLAVLGAVLTSLGLHAAFEGDAIQGWHFGLSIPPLAELRHDAWDVLSAYAMQQIGYSALAGKKI